MTGQPNDYNGLASTPRRRQLLDLIAEQPGSVYYRVTDEVIWCVPWSTRVTADVTKLFKHQWVEVIPPDQRTDQQRRHTARVSYRITELGERARMHGRESSRG